MRHALRPMIFALGLATASSALAADNGQIWPAEVSIPNTRQVKFTSAINGEPYALFVSIPFIPPPPGGYPVYYVLDGEAYFAVAKNRRLPFEVSTHKARITVLSTIFDVRDYKNSSEFQAAVVKGSINVSDGKKTVKLRAGEAARIDTFSAGLHKIDKYDTARGLAWRSNFFDFTDLNVRQSMQALAGWYGKDSIVILSGVDTVSPGLISAGLIRKGWDLNKLLPNLGKRHHIHLHSEGKRIIAKPL